MSSPTYNDGLYTPWTPSGGGDTWQAAETTSQEWQQPSSTAPAWTPDPTTTPAWTPSPSSSQDWTPSTSSSSEWTSSDAWSSSSSSSEWSSSSSSSMTPAQSTVTLTTTSLWSSSSASQATIIRPTLASSASGQTASKPTFKVLYLVPVFVAIPAIALALFLFWFFKRRRQQDDDWSPRFSSYTEKEDLVKGRYVGDDDYPEPYAVPGASKNWLPATVRNFFGGQSRSEQDDRASYEPETHHFVNYDQPFVPPSPEKQREYQDQQYEANDQFASDDRGWTWGLSAGPPARQPTRTKTKKSIWRANSSGLTNGFKWAQKRYRAKPNGNSISSRASMRDYDPGSVSVYSPNVGRYQPEQQQSMYAGVADDEVTGQDLDAFLGESRVGHGDRANRWVQGRPLPDDVPPPPAQTSLMSFVHPSVVMPTAPASLHASPTKREHDTTRGELRSIDRSQQQGNSALIFAYDSPVRTNRAARPALPTPPAFPSSVPPRNIGSPMPAFEQGSTSAYDLAGVQELIFGSTSVAPAGRDEHAARRHEDSPRRQQPYQAPIVTRRDDRFEDAAPTNGQDVGRQYRDTRRSLRPQSQTMSTAPFEFSDVQTIEPLAHPSHVKNAIETFESKSTSSPKRYTRPALMETASSHQQQPQRSSSRPRSSSASSAKLQHGLNATVDPNRPLSSDPSRLSAKLRAGRRSSFAVLDEDEDNDDEEQRGGLAAMLRKSTNS